MNKDEIRWTMSKMIYLKQSQKHMPAMFIKDEELGKLISDAYIQGEDGYTDTELFVINFFNWYI